jgi:hypothetical protein
MAYTQSEFDNIVLEFSKKGVDFMSFTCDLHRQGDPDAKRLEEEYMFLQNVLSALRDYDVDVTTVLSTDDINYLFELATNVLQRSPMPSSS